MQALGRVGRTLIDKPASVIKKTLSNLKKIDWSRDNSILWEGRAFIGGTISKTTNCITLTTNVIKQALGIELSQEEAKVEQAFLKSRVRDDK